MADYIKDPAGIFRSDAHRHVLGHMAIPSDDYGWDNKALGARVSSSVQEVDDVKSILDELVQDGLAEQVNGAWRQTDKGFELLTGPIDNEPGPDASPEGPAVVTRATPIPKREEQAE
jgi:hypothetical protein